MPPYLWSLKRLQITDMIINYSPSPVHKLHGKFNPLCIACEENSVKVRNSHQCGRNIDYTIYSTAVKQGLIVCTCGCHGMKGEYLKMTTAKTVGASA